MQPSSPVSNSESNFVKSSGGPVNKEVPESNTNLQGFSYEQIPVSSSATKSYWASTIQ